MTLPAPVIPFVKPEEVKAKSGKRGFPKTQFTVALDAAREKTSKTKLQKPLHVLGSIDEEGPLFRLGLSTKNPG